MSQPALCLLSWWYLPGILVLGRWKREDQEFKVILRLKMNSVNLQPAWATCDPARKKEVVYPTFKDQQVWEATFLWRPLAPTPRLLCPRQFWTGWSSLFFPSEPFSYFITSSAIWSQGFKFHPHFRAFGLGVLPEHPISKSIAAVGILNVSEVHV